MPDKPLSTGPRAGKKRYKGVFRDPQKPSGEDIITQTVDVCESFSIEQLNTWAKGSAKQRNFEFICVEPVNDDPAVELRKWVVATIQERLDKFFVSFAKENDLSIDEVRSHARLVLEVPVMSD